MEAKTIHNLDLRGLIIPLILLKASNAFKALKAGEILEILCNEPDALEDLLKILSSSPCDLNMMKKVEEDESYYRIILKKLNKGR